MSDRDPRHLYPKFRVRFFNAVDNMQYYLDVHHLGWTCKMVEGYRTAKYQFSLWKIGRWIRPIGKQYQVTQRDGYVRQSEHQKGMSGDLGFFSPTGKYSAPPTAECWHYWGHCLREQHLDWGGDWKSFVDRPHGEWDPHDRSEYQLAKAWIHMQEWR